MGIWGRLRLGGYAAACLQLPTQCPPPPAASVHVQGLPSGSLTYNEWALQSHPPPAQQPALAQQAIDAVFQATHRATTRPRPAAPPRAPPAPAGPPPGAAK